MNSESAVAMEWDDGVGVGDLSPRPLRRSRGLLTMQECRVAAWVQQAVTSKAALVLRMLAMLVAVSTRRLHLQVSQRDGVTGSNETEPW